MGSGDSVQYRPNGLVLHWTRGTWVTAATPKTSTGVALNGVTAVTPGNVWAVGQSVTGSGPYRAYALHWNGRRWAPVSVPSRGQGTGDRQFNSVVPIGHGQLVAVGTDSLSGAPGSSALYALWNGHSWSVTLQATEPPECRKTAQHEFVGHALASDFLAGTVMAGGAGRFRRLHGGPGWPAGLLARAWYLPVLAAGQHGPGQGSGYLAHPQGARGNRRGGREP
jgi:hypothetical protein